MARLNRDQLLQLARSEVQEITVNEMKKRVDGGDEMTLIDIRERDEWVQGHIPTRHSAARSPGVQIEQHQPDARSRGDLLCGGVRSLLAARNCKGNGLYRVYSLTAGSAAGRTQDCPSKCPRC